MKKEKKNDSNQFIVRLPSYLEKFSAFRNTRSFREIDRHFKKVIFNKKRKITLGDMMCGTGKIGLHLKEKYPEFTKEVVFCDASESMLEGVPKGLKRVRSFSENLNIRDDFFDILIVRYGLNNVEKSLYPKIIKEYLRVLKPEGTIIIQDHFPRNRREEERINNIETFVKIKDGRNDTPYIPALKKFKNLINKEGGKIIKRSCFNYDFSMLERFQSKGIKKVDLEEIKDYLLRKDLLKFYLPGKDIILQYPISTISICHK